MTMFRSVGVALFIALLCAGLSARAANPQPYIMDFGSTGDATLDSTLRATSEMAALRDSAPVGPFGLIGRARGDVDRFKTVLESDGYYQSSVAIKIEGQTLDSPDLGDALTALPKGRDARIVVSFTLGPRYHLRKVTLDGVLPPSAAGTFGLKAGDVAVAADVLAAGAHLQSVLQEDGYAFAKVDSPEAYEDEKLPVLDVVFHVEAGARVTIGEIRFDGLKRVHATLLRRRLTIHTGERYRSSAIEAARRDLLTLGPFATISVKLGTVVDSTGGVPITFDLRERPRHAVTLNAAYSSDLGGSGGVRWSDRNVFGNAELLTISARVINLGGSDTTGVGYDTTAQLTLPEFEHRDQSLQLSVGALKQYLLAYDQSAVTAGATLTRKLSSVWSASVGLNTSNELILQEGVHYNYSLVALPLTLSYDSTHLASPLDDPLHGMRNSVSVTPTESLGRIDASFVITQIKLAAYIDLSEFGIGRVGRSVLALRALADQAEGASTFSLPPDQRFYAGGSGTIRGYRYQSVGPLFPVTSQYPVTDNPIGGTALAAGTVEFRQRFTDAIGAAAFIDGGQVSERLNFLPRNYRFGTGAGLRYYTPIGPIRFDLAVPTHRERGDDAFEVYVGLGQAF